MGALASSGNYGDAARRAARRHLALARPVRIQAARRAAAHPGAGRDGLWSAESKRSERTIALDPETVAALEAHREAQLVERALAGDAYVDLDLIFCNELGGVIYPPNLTSAFLRHRKAVGLTTGTLHILRHTAATLALTADPPVPLHIVAGRLGDDPTTLLHTYAHRLPNSDEQAAAMLAARIADKPLTNLAV